ncbi:MAG TPA: hypothetical protein VLE72_02320 [Candidatus Saccharimonadales bacterium]|nr:hypothetical protein [Candidatus Saccharimonadales bacterium]
MPKTKTKPNGFNLARKLNFSKSQLAAIIAAGVAIGGFVAYQTFAATVPPSNLRQTISGGAGGGGVTTISTWVINTVSATPYGAATPALNMKNSDPHYWQTGNWNFSTGFNKTSDYLKSLTSDGWPKSNTFLCGNSNSYFYGMGPLQTPYGPLYFGQVYRLYNNKWQVKWANYSTVTKGCSTSTNWMDVTPGPGNL